VNHVEVEKSRYWVWPPRTLLEISHTLAQTVSVYSLAFETRKGSFLRTEIPFAYGPLWDPKRKTIDRHSKFGLRVR